MFARNGGGVNGQWLESWILKQSIAFGAWRGEGLGREIGLDWGAGLNGCGGIVLPVPKGGWRSLSTASKLQIENILLNNIIYIEK